MAHHPDLEALNRADDHMAVACVLPMIERAPDLAARVAADRPFPSAEALAQRIADEIHALDDSAAIALFRGHPELASPDPETMTQASQSEQRRLHLGAALAEFAQLNARYRDHFGFPFILALHEHDDLQSVLAVFRDRVQARPADEIAANKAEICSVSSARVLSTFGAQSEAAS